MQRFVLDELDARWLLGEPWVDSTTLAEQLEGSPPTRRARRSIGRALRRLAADGLVELRAGRDRLQGRVARGRADDVAARAARRERASELRRQLRGDA